MDDIEPIEDATVVDTYDPNAEDGEPEAPDVRTDPVEDDPATDHQPAED